MKQKDIKCKDDKTAQHCKVFVSGHHQHNYFQVPIFFKDKRQAANDLSPTLLYGTNGDAFASCETSSETCRSFLPPVLKVILRIIKEKDPISWEQIKMFGFLFLLPNKIWGGYNCCYKYIMGKCWRRGESFTILDNVGIEINICSIDVQSSHEWRKMLECFPKTSQKKFCWSLN